MNKHGWIKVEERLPEHVAEVLPKLKRWANGVAGFYGCPVYLVGSALNGDNPKPRDWDVRIEMPDEDFAIRFGSPQEWSHEGGTGEWTDVRWKWSAECVRETKKAWYRTVLNIDFQIYPKSHSEQLYPEHFPRLLLAAPPPEES